MYKHTNENISYISLRPDGCPLMEMFDPVQGFVNAIKKPANKYFVGNRKLDRLPGQVRQGPYRDDYRHFSYICPEDLRKPFGLGPVGVPAFFVPYGLHIDDKSSGAGFDNGRQAPSEGCLVFFAQKVSFALVDDAAESGVVLNGKKWFVKVDHASSMLRTSEFVGGYSQCGNLHSTRYIPCCLDKY